jgi:hypothetical protein
MKVVKVFVDRRSFLYLQPLRESSSVGRARPCQGRGRGFESRFSLQMPPTPGGILILGRTGTGPREAPEGGPSPLPGW